jgi:hypothetical protein
MYKLSSLLVGLAALTGCAPAEHWFSLDDNTLDVDTQFALVDATVTTTPEAFPRDLYGQALRLRMDDAEVAFLGEVVNGVVLDEARDIDDHWGDNVNVLDAWSDCPPDEVCERTFRFEISRVGDLTDPGLVEADAFLSTFGLKPERFRGGSLVLDLELVEELD